MGKIFEFLPRKRDRIAREWLFNAGILNDACHARDAAILAFSGANVLFRLREPRPVEMPDGSVAASPVTCGLVIYCRHTDWENEVAPRLRHVNSWALKHLPPKAQSLLGLEVENGELDDLGQTSD